LRPSAITYRVVQVAGELDEQVGVQARHSLVVFDLHSDFASRTAAGDLTEFLDARDAIVVAEHACDPKRIGEKARSAAAQAHRVSGERQAELVTDDPTVILRAHNRSPGLFGRTHQHVVDRHPAVARHHEQHRIGDVLGTQLDHTGGLALERLSR